MTEDTTSTTDSKATGADAAAGAAEPPEAAAAAPEASAAEAAFAERKGKIGSLFTIIRHAIGLAGMESSVGLLQIAAFLVDEACERSKRTHAEGIDQVKITLAAVQAERDDAGAIVDQLMELITKARKP
jgi:hypothetical protein